VWFAIEHLRSQSRLAVSMRCRGLRRCYRLFVIVFGVGVSEGVIVGRGFSYFLLAAFSRDLMAWAYQRRPPNKGAEGLNAPNMVAMVWLLIARAVMVCG